MQQVLAFESDLLEYDDIFNGSHVIEALTDELVAAAQAELDDVLAQGGAFAAIEELKGRLVASNTERVRRIETGEQIVVGVNKFTETAESPLAGDESILRVDPAVEAQTIAEIEQWRAVRDDAAVDAALAELRRVAATDENIMNATIALAVAGGTTGEWAGALRDIFGEYRAPTGVAAAAGVGTLPEDLRAVAERVKVLPGGPPRFLVGKPGLDGHSNGAEQIAVAARDAGMEVIYQGIRLTPAQIAAVARDEDVDVVGLSILSGSHMQLVPDVVDRLRAEGVTCPVIVGGIIPEDDRPKLLAAGVARVYTPKDFELGNIMGDIADLVAESRN
jgi:(2R)-ethylmalonyl-CoA mutase